VAVPASPAYCWLSFFLFRLSCFSVKLSRWLFQPLLLTVGSASLCSASGCCLAFLVEFQSLLLTVGSASFCSASPVFLSSFPGGVPASPAHCWLCFSLFSLSCFSDSFPLGCFSLSCSLFALILSV
jgi:hypothetical protein